MDQVLDMLRPYLEPSARKYADPARRKESTSDLLQECCLRTWQKLESFQGGENDQETFAMFRSWMGQILRRLGLNAQRDRLAKSQIPPQKVVSLPPDRGESAEPLDEPALQDSARSPSDGARANEVALKIRAALDGLSDQTGATIVFMHFFEGLAISQITGRLGLGPTLVRKHYRSAMVRLRRELGNLLDEWP